MGGCSCSASTCRCSPIFSIGTGNEGWTGWLVPEIAFDQEGAGARGPLSLADRAQPRLDTHAAHLHRRLPAIEAKYRELDQLGAFQLGGFLTYGGIKSADPTPPQPRGRGFRAYIEANGRLQLDPYWSLTGALRWATDKTVTRRYDLTRDDRLRNFINLERITPIHISGSPAGFQGCGSTTSRSKSRLLCRRSTRATGPATLSSAET